MTRTLLAAPDKFRGTATTAQAAASHAPSRRSIRRSKWMTCKRSSNGWQRTATAWSAASASTSTSGAWPPCAGRRGSSSPSPSESTDPSAEPAGKDGHQRTLSDSSGPSPPLGVDRSSAMRVLAPGRHTSSSARATRCCRGERSGCAYGFCKDACPGPSAHQTRLHHHCDRYLTARTMRASVKRAASRRADKTSHAGKSSGRFSHMLRSGGQEPESSRSRG